MAIDYVNRRGDTYYLHQGQTKTGKPTYFFSRTREGTLADTIPDGYEIYESPNCQVFLRKIQPRLVTEEEVATVQRAVRKHAGFAYLVDVKGKHIVVYEGRMPVMRFTLEDKETRQFAVDRWCFRGSIDDWIPLSFGDLPKLVARYCPHLGKESFFDLMIGM
jgi:hypothetical protein